ncbi:MoaD/ThiS family protein [Chloroflexota bacterium]
MPGKVRLEISPELAGVVSAGDADWVILEKAGEEWATVGDLLTDLASKHTDFRKAVFAPDTGEVNDQVLIVLNGNLLPPPEVAEAELKGGDTVLLLPVCYGG